MQRHLALGTSTVHQFRLPRSHWDSVWAAWCPTCAEEAMPLSSGICGFCDTYLTGQRTRGPYDPPLGKGEDETAAILGDDIATAA